MKTKNKLLIILSLIILNAGCKKQDLQDQNTAQQNSVLQTIKTWLETQAVVSGSQKFLLDGKLIDIPQKILWSKTIAYSQEKINITPVSFGSVTGDLPVNKYLVTEIDAKGSVRSGSYYVLLTNKKETSGMEDIPAPDLLNAKSVPEDFNGAIIKYDLNNNILSAKHYSSGILSDKTDKIEIRKSKNQVPVENTAPLPEGCSYVTIDWYWQVWVNGILVYEQYLYSSSVVYCEGGGGGGGGGGNGPTCEELNTTFVNQGNSLSGPLHSVTEFYDGTIWVKAYNWSIYQAGTWGLLSYEKGTLELKHYPNNLDRWEFQSFEHIRIAEAGMVIGGTRTFTDLSATINITPTRMSVWEQINYTVSSKITCFTNPMTIPYNANKTFYAPNTVVYE